MSTPGVIAPELSIQPGTTIAQRRAQLDAVQPFVKVRNLVYMHYKKPDGSQLMPYQETLGLSHDVVKDLILRHELAQGLIADDGTLNVPVDPAAATTAVPQGAAEMSQPQYPGAPGVPVPPQPGVPQFAPAAPQAPFVPQAPQAPAPMQQAAQVPAGMPPPPQAAMPPQQQQAVPPPPAPPEGGGSRRGRRPAGAAAAPPPPAPPPVAQAQQPVAPPGFAPPVPGFQQVAVPGNGASPYPAPQFPGAPQAAPQFAPAQAAPPPPQAAASVDLTPVLSRLDAIGGLVDALSKKVDEEKVREEELLKLGALTLAALHHLYLTHPQLAPGTQGQANTLPEFKKFLAQFAGVTLP